MKESSWKTTLLGVIGIVAAICAAAKSLLTGASVDWSLVVSSVTSGAAAIFAKDHDKS